jgi:hypothetical protein
MLLAKYEWNVVFSMFRMARLKVQVLFCIRWF